MLRLSIDDVQEDEDVHGTACSLPFVIHEDLLEQYGDRYEVKLDEHGMPVVEAPGHC